MNINSDSENSIDNIYDIIKTLKPFEIFFYYDGPKFYSCYDKNKQLYLINWIEENIEDSYDLWMYLQISKNKYSSLINKNISVKEVMGDPETGIVYVVKNYGSGKFDVNIVEKCNILEEWLPSEDCYI